MKRIASLLVVLVAVSTTAFAVPAGAEPVAATATGVGASATTGCSENPSFDVSGSTVGDGFGSDGWGTVAGEVARTPEIIPSPLYDNWSATDVDWGVVFPAPAPPGTVRGLYAVIATPDLDPTTSVEWFILYACGSGVDSAVRAACFGPVGTCPRSVDEALRFEATASPADPRAGEAVAVSMTGCAGGQVVAALVDETDREVDRTAPRPGDRTGVAVALTVPTDARVGTTATVLATCSIEGVAPVALTLTVTAEPPTTTTTTRGSTSTTTPAPSVAVTPRFAG